MFQLDMRNPLNFQLTSESKMKHWIGTQKYNTHALCL